MEPHFARAVILMGEHSEEGAMGIVLNRPSEASVAEAVPGLAELVPHDEVVHIGGPVSPAAVTLLAEFEDPGEAATIVFGDVGFARGDGDNVLLAAATRRTRVFAGYAGWAPGQLEAELAQDGWILATPEPDDVFSGEGLALWSSVLRRKGGRFELLARMPPDPSMN